MLITYRLVNLIIFTYTDSGILINLMIDGAIMKLVRTRFAPSPTGFVHVGSLRTALYNYLFAKHNNGDFILRIEDTDQSRTVKGAIDNIINALSWANIMPDEGPEIGGPYSPYLQSERLPLYQKHAHQLVKEGKAYYCTCSPERLERVRERQIAAKQPPSYDRHCRDINLKPKEGEPYVIRMKVPRHGDVTFHDLIRGDVTIGYRTVDDQVILKSDGFPTYHLAVVVDDHYMKISHVIRGEEWISSMPKHILLYEYFGWEMPLHAHLPLLLNPDRSKLSKRQGDVAVEDFRAKGYLPQVLINFVALLGWNPGDTREIFFMDDLIKEFTLKRVGKSGAIFDVDKLNWLNEQHIRLKSDEELLAMLRPIVDEREFSKVDDLYLLHVIQLLKERVVFVHDFVDRYRYFFEDPTSYDETAAAKWWTKETTKQLHLFADRCAPLPVFDAAMIEKVIRDQAAEQNISASKIIHPLRLAVSGVTVGPSLFHMLEILGKEVVLPRVYKVVELIEGF